MEMEKWEDRSSECKECQMSKEMLEAMKVNYDALEKRMVDFEKMERGPATTDKEAGRKECVLRGPGEKATKGRDQWHDG